jgi:hypothetical protein
VTSFAIPEALPNDTYRAYVRVKDQHQWSDWAYSQFTVSVTPPDPPTAVVTDQPAQGRVAIAVTPDNSPVATDGLLIERSLDGGDTWEAMRSGEEATSSAHTFYDYEAPSGVEVTYRASGWNDTSTGRLYSSALVFTHTHEGNWWIKHPHRPSLNVALFMRGNATRSKAMRQAEHQAAGRSDVVIYQDTPGPDKGEITFMVEEFDGEEADALDAILDSGSVLLLAGRAQDAWRDRWVVFGDRTTTRLEDKSFIGESDVSLSWTEVARPDGDFLEDDF